MLVTENKGILTNYPHWPRNVLFEYFFISIATNMFCIRCDNLGREWFLTNVAACDNMLVKVVNKISLV